MIAWLKGIARFLIDRHNDFWYPVPQPDPSGDPLLDEIRRHAMVRTDISDHLETLYKLAVAATPNLIVELGVRSGESTFALERAARKTGAWLVSVDVEPVGFTSDYERWRFVQRDDVALAEGFAHWAGESGLPDRVDVLFVDTSHETEHTRRELAAWMPLLSEDGVAAFHDTNMGWLIRRKDRSLCGGWWNRRGVIRALEEWLGVSLDETVPFERTIGEWQVQHVPWCSGFTVLRRTRK